MLKYVAMSDRCSSCQVDVAILASAVAGFGQESRFALLLEERSHAVERGADVVEAVGVGEADVALAVGAEGAAGQRRNAGLVEKAVLHRDRVHTRGADVGEGVEGARGRSTANARQGVQAGHN